MRNAILDDTFKGIQETEFFYFNGRSVYRVRLRKSFLEIVIICKFRPIWIGREKILEKAMATHSSTLAWQIPWMEEPDRLQSMGSLGVRHD